MGSQKNRQGLIEEMRRERGTKKERKKKEGRKEERRDKGKDKKKGMTKKEQGRDIERKTDFTQLIWPLTIFRCAICTQIVTSFQMPVRETTRFTPSSPTESTSPP